MIQEHELRKGNYINTGKFHIKEKQGFHKYESKWCKYVHMFNPIPLTEEWLLKFGFSKLYCDDRENDIFAKILEDRYDFIIEPYYTGKDLINPKFMVVESLGQIEVEVKYVHQLQNLYFALTGEELILKHDE